MQPPHAAEGLPNESERHFGLLVCAPMDLIIHRIRHLSRVYVSRNRSPMDTEGSVYLAGGQAVAIFVVALQCCLRKLKKKGAPKALAIFPMMTL